MDALHLLWIGPRGRIQGLAARTAAAARAAFAPLGRCLAAVFEALVPAPCLLCAGADGPLCPECRERKAEELRPLGRRAEHGAGSLPLAEDGEPVRAWAGGEYSHERAALMLTFKSRGVTSLAHDMGGFLSAALGAAGAGPGDVLVPVPGTLRAAVKRGYDPLDLLLDRAAQAFPGVAIAPAVRRRRRWQTVLTGQRGAGMAGRHASGQKGLGARARAVRLRSAFETDPRWAGAVAGAERILVADDVLTTGATAAAVCRALAEASHAPCEVVTALAARGSGAPDGKEEHEAATPSGSGDPRQDACPGGMRVREGLRRSG
ncbi:ComF family protein [Arthrobacter sp. UM1]|uniref:ComF family protein n=1 Tax=Arthrobacter sp. UM1 TaxID=2766776 RepID=UPI001CF6437D|nr:hypothetical protein [Arthrobacter sp. UM1]MCB4207778.1 ComF family protein [Arthrobacter sp. UM1]